MSQKMSVSLFSSSFKSIHMVANAGMSRDVQTRISTPEELETSAHHFSPLPGMSQQVWHHMALKAVLDRNGSVPKPME